MFHNVGYIFNLTRKMLSTNILNECLSFTNNDLQKPINGIFC